ncbi:protein ELC-like [Phoenix dactylifera]|uniref:Protein ELC-like n=1 Tax=Phoenix dactylifera TaxID=42345 RepID=A0A8B7CPB9_PHODC|nr:protein ELC-like [Phoenix dactylifera]
MAPSSSIGLIDAALSNAGPDSLSYVHSNLKWLIRKNLISLLEDFPTLSPSTGTFTHDDGTAVNLLNAHGFLPTSPSMQPILLTIWLHQCYPFKPPIVYVIPTQNAKILHDHPFVDSSGATTSPYLKSWQYPRSNLSDLAHDLVKIFHLCPPYTSSLATSACTDPSLSFKIEAIGKLFMRIDSDKLRFRAQVEKDIEHLSNIQAALHDRARVIASILLDLEEEKASLELTLEKVVEDADVLSNWLREQGANSLPMDELEAFEASNEKSRRWMENEAAELAIDDVMDALGKALEEGAVAFEVYLKQVRALAREQYFHRDLVMKMEMAKYLSKREA